MAVTINRPVASEVTAPSKRKRTSGHQKPAPLPTSLNDDHVRLRVAHLLTIFGIGASTLYRRIELGYLPSPSGTDGRPFWLTQHIRPYLVAPAILAGRESAAHEARARERGTVSTEEMMRDAAIGRELLRKTARARRMKKPPLT